MELIEKQKFKQTEVGLIPEDWKVNTLGKVAFVTKLAGFEYSLHFNSYKDEGDIIVVRGTNITHNKMDLRDVKTIPTSTSNKLLRSKLFKNDLVFAYVGTIGPIFLIEENDRYHLGPNTAKITVEKEINSKYLYHYFTSSFIANEIFETTSIGAQPSLSMTKIRSFKIITPSLKEQKAIATALSDVDELITNLAQLIAKKKAIKQGAMQQLLTPPHKGGKRLAGFNGEWVEKKLGEYTDLITKGTTPTSLGKAFTTEGINFIKAESIDKSGKIIKDKVAFIDSETHEILGRSKMKANDLLFTIAGVLGRVGVIMEENLPANTNQAVAIIRLKKNFNLSIHFFFHILRTNEIEKHIDAISVQGAQANFSLTDVANIPLKIPVDYKEQEEIAKILSDIDLDLKQLETKKAKYQAIKQGMMQELLTGKTRLV